MRSLCLALGIRAGSKVSVIQPPPGFAQRLNPLPDGVEFLVTAQTGLDVILFFPSDARDLVARLPALSRAMALTGGVWVCWSTRGPALLDEAFIRQAALDIGMVDDKRVELDPEWAGLRLVWKTRPRAEKPESRKRASATA